MVITVETDLNTLKKNETKRSLYTFYSAKKIYLSRMSSKIVFLEKKAIDDSLKVISLKERETIVVNKRNGMLVFPRTR